MEQKNSVYCHLHCLRLLQKESQKNEATQMQRRHERKKEKRKKSARLQLQLQHQQSVERSQEQTGTTAQAEDPHVQPQPREPQPSEPPPPPLPAQIEKPQRTVIKTEPKTTKASADIRSIPAAFNCRISKPDAVTSSSSSLGS